MRFRVLIALSVAIVALLVALFLPSDLMFWSIGAAIVGIVYAAWAFALRVYAPLSRLQTVLEERTRGNREARLSYLGQGEIGRIIQALNELDRKQQMDHRNLAHNLDRLQTVFTQMTDGVVIVGRDSKVESANDTALRLFSTNSAVAVSGSFAQLVRHHEIIETFQRCIETQTFQSTVVDMRRDGLYLQVDITPLLSDDLQGYIVLLHDLTNIRRVENVRRDFVSNVSHELRTPLASMKAVVETLQDGAMDDPPMAERFLERAAQEIDSMTQMVEELLELSRIESGKVPLKLEAVELWEIVESAAQRLESQIVRKNLNLEINLGQDLPLVLADAQRVEQVLTNLLHNATKFTPEGGRIRVGATQNDQEMMISVRDNGIGIPEDDVSRVFERFYKTDRSRNSRGTGLGLAIAKHVIQAHGGEIWATSKSNKKGSVFYFTLPVTKSVKAL